MTITTRSALVASMLFAAALSACGVSPQKACEAQVELWSKAGKVKDAEGQKKTMALCVKEAEALKEKDPEHYKCRANCDVHASDADGMMNCHDSCSREFRKK